MKITKLNRQNFVKPFMIISNVTGTLADLKKQRAQIRTNGSPVESSVNSTTNHSLNSIPEIPKQDPQIQISPITTNTTVPRFSGNTSDVVGDTKSRRCCIIM